MQRKEPTILIASCGNADAGGDAFGPMVTAELRDVRPSAINIVELGMRPAALLDYLDGVHTLVLVDAVVIPDIGPGRLIDTDWFDPARPQLVHEDPLSTHGMSINHQLALSQQLDMLPERIRLIGCTIDGARKNIHPGTPCDPRVTAQVPEAVRRILVHYSVLPSAPLMEAARA